MQLQPSQAIADPAELTPQLWWAGPTPETGYRYNNRYRYANCLNSESMTTPQNEHRMTHPSHPYFARMTVVFAGLFLLLLSSRVSAHAADRGFVLLPVSYTHLTLPTKPASIDARSSIKAIVLVAILNQA